MEIVLALLLLGVLVTFHELGHYLAGRWSGVYIHEFAVGFGPVLFSRMTDETRYSLRLIPIGGFCRFAGEDDSMGQEDQNIPKERLLNSQPLGKRAFIMAAGPFANILVAALSFCIVFAFIGVNQPTTTVLDVIPGYPARSAGLQAGDTILAVEDQRIDSWDHMVSLIQKRAGVPTAILFERNGIEQTLTLEPLEVDGVGMLGIRPTGEKIRQGLLKGLITGVMETLIVSSLWIKGIVGMLFGKIAPEIAGPLGITQILGEAVGMGFGEVTYLAGALSANLALMNLLPIPALDGSRLIFIGLEAIRGRPIDPEKESFVHFIGFFLLIALFVFVTYRDIMRIIRG